MAGGEMAGREVADGDVDAAVVERGDGPERVAADHYVAAVPLEVMAGLLDDDLLAAAPELAGVRELETAWMNGIQFYLPEDVPVVPGHEIYVDSPWALTSISQAQFWDVDLPARSDGAVEGVLSVIVSDWTTPGTLHGKPATECTPAEIAEEVWAQLRAHLADVEGAEPLDAPLDEAVVDWFLDPAIEAADGASTDGEAADREAADGETADGEAANVGVTNAAPLLVNTVGSLRHRPPADPGAGNLYLAADYVRTNTDLASMESADEAARRAVRAILAAEGSAARAPEVWDLPEPPVFEPLKAQDRARFRLGLPHPGDARRKFASALRDGVVGRLFGG